MNLIDRTKVLKTIPSEEMVARMAVMSAPVVDAQPVRHGKWDYVTVVDEGYWQCSNCGTPSEALGARKLYKYCPFCGAKMDAEQEKQSEET